MPTRSLLVTGATGFVGAPLTLELLRQRRDDVALCVVRATSDAEAQRRLDGALRTAAAAYAIPDVDALCRRAVALRGDVTAPGLGLDDAARARLGAAAPFDVFHAAASLKDTEEALAEIVLHNVVGTERVVEALLPLGAATFNHVSTAYVCGRRTADIVEAVERPRGFHNRYEQSKYYGETIVVDHCERAGVPWRILRPAIVVGHSVTGAATGFTGFLGWVLKLCAIADAAGGALATRPLRYLCAADTTLNCIPIDSIVEDIVGIDAAGAATEGRVFHLTNREPPTVSALIGTIARTLGVLVEPAPVSTAETALDPVSAKFHRWTRFERPYVAASRDFRRDGDRLYASPRHGAAPLDEASIVRMTRATAAAYARHKAARAG